MLENLQGEYNVLKQKYESLHTKFKAQKQQLSSTQIDLKAVYEQKKKFDEKMDEQLVKVRHLDKIIKNKDEIIESLQQEKHKLS